MSDAVDDSSAGRSRRRSQRRAGNMTRAAARLGLERSHLYKKMKKLGGKKERHAP
jgi:DNA-binding NtrC family response regulator